LGSYTRGAIGYQRKTGSPCNPLVCRYRPSGGELGPAYTPLATQEDSDSEEELFPVGGGRNAGHTLVYTWREYMRQVTPYTQRSNRAKGLLIWVT